MSRKLIIVLIHHRHDHYILFTKKYKKRERKRRHLQRLDGMRVIKEADIYSEGDVGRVGETHNWIRSGLMPNPWSENGEEFADFVFPSDETR